MSLYVVSYHEVQIAGYRIFTSYEEALKEFLKHCILETQALLLEDEDAVAIESLSDSDDTSASEAAEAVDAPESEDDFDEMSCTLEIQELQGNEYVTTKEFDYETFETLLEEKDDVPSYLDELEKQIDQNQIPDEILTMFR